MAADMAVVMSATFNGGHFWLVLRRTGDALGARQLAAAALALLNTGLALQALVLLASVVTEAPGREPGPLLGPTAALVRGPALVGSLLISGLVLRDRIRNGGGW